MSQIDLIILFVAACLGTFDAHIAISNRSLNIAWLIGAIWAALKLMHAL